MYTITHGQTSAELIEESRKRLRQAQRASERLLQIQDELITALDAEDDPSVMLDWIQIGNHPSELPHCIRKVASAYRLINRV